MGLGSDRQESVLFRPLSDLAEYGGVHHESDESARSQFNSSIEKTADYRTSFKSLKSGETTETTHNKAPGSVSGQVNNVPYYHMLQKKAQRLRKGKRLGLNQVNEVLGHLTHLELA